MNYTMVMPREKSLIINYKQRFFAAIDLDSTLWAKGFDPKDEKESNVNKQSLIDSLNIMLAFN